jgi:hypothetical protein
MWILSFIPDSWLHLAVISIMLCGVGMYVLSMFLSLIPPLFPYKEPMRILATVLMIAGVYFYGGYSTEMMWRDKVADLQKQVVIAEAASKEVNGKIQTKIVTQIQTVKDVQIVIEERIREVASKIDSECKVDPVAIRILNDSAKNIKKSPPQPLTLKLDMELHNG